MEDRYQRVRRWPLRAAALCLGLGACLDACPATPGTAELRFLDNGGTVREVVGAVGARTVGPAELGPVPSLPLLGLDALHAVDLVGQNVSLAPVNNQGLPGPQIEAHLFVADLGGLDTYLRGVGAGEPIQRWDDRTRPGSLGLDVAIPFPPNPGWNVANRYQVPFLLPVVFWPGIEPLPPASDPDPPGRGSVKSVRFYRPGLCGMEVSFADSSAPGVNNARLYDTISDTLFTKFASNDKLDRGSARRAWSRVTTLLDDGLDIFGPRGGFFLYFWFSATAARGLQDINFTANYEYQFTLVDGRGAVVPTRNDLLVQPQQSFGDFRDALEKDLPQNLGESFVDKQKKGFGTCSGDAGDDPVNAVNLVAGFADAGGAKLGLSAADRTRLQNAIRQPANWSCDRRGDDGAKTANFILRAKRINVYPDALELVWFDEQNPDDPMFALYAAAVTVNATGDLCARPRTIVDGSRTTYVRRPLVTVAR